MARLTYKVDGDERVLELDPENACRIGRDPACQVSLPDVRGVSRRHCQIMALPHGGRTVWELTDLGATNKTHVNGKPTDRCVLASGDSFAVGECQFDFTDEAEEKQLREAGSKGVCYLEWVTGGQKGAKVWLDKPRVTMGRRDSSTITLDDRMASGHHAEIVKDLNGFTVRDLGSTNGTLVNGEPTTEAPLNHGTRIRIGNSRFVFKDPSMKDIEIELSQFDGDDDGWGMMGDIDLTKARGSYGGLLAGLVLLGLVGASAYFFLNDKKTKNIEGVAANTLVTNHNFDDAENLLWAEEGGEDDSGITISGKGKNSALKVLGNEAEEGVVDKPRIVVYDESFAALDKPLHLMATSRASGDGSGLVGIWRSGAGSTSNISRTVMLQPANGDSVDVHLSRPPWAESLSLAVRVAPDGNVSLDNLIIDYDAESDAKNVKLDCPGDPTAQVNYDGTLDILNNATIMATGCGPVVQLADGTVLTRFVATGAPSSNGSVRGEMIHPDGEPVPVEVAYGANSDGLTVSVKCKGAKAVGLQTLQPVAHLSSGVHVLTTKGPRTVGTEAGVEATNVRKTLAGEPKATGQRPVTLVTMSPWAAEGETAPTTRLEVAEAADSSLLAIRQWTTGQDGAYVLVTDYRAQDAKAQAAYDAAKKTLASQAILGIGQLRSVAQEFPFAEAVRERATKDAATTEQGVRKQIDGFSKALHDFRIFQSDQALGDLTSHQHTLAKSFEGVTAEQGALVSDAQELLKQATVAKADYLRKNAGFDLSRIERLANLLAGTEGYKPMAALLFKTIGSRYADLSNDESFRARMEQAATRLKELQSDPAVKAALPPSALEK